VPQAFSVPRAKHSTQCSLREKHNAAPSSVSRIRSVHTSRSHLVSGLTLLLLKVGLSLLGEKENIFVAPSSRQIVVGRGGTEKEQILPPLVCAEPAQMPIEGILPSRVLSRVKASALEPSSESSPVSCSEKGTPSSCAYVMVANVNHETLTILKAIILGIAEEVFESLVDKINANSDSPTRQRRRKRTKLFTKSSGRTN
jgi:hypothetical protein